MNAEKNNIISEGQKYVVNPFDEFALEEAIRYKEKNPIQKLSLLQSVPRAHTRQPAFPKICNDKHAISVET
ncbi:MAG: hypothetical protein ACYDG6_01740 [Thermincolia bacterium]